MLYIVTTLEMMKLESRRRGDRERGKQVIGTYYRIPKAPDKPGVKKLNEETGLKGIKKGKSTKVLLKQKYRAL